MGLGYWSWEWETAIGMLGLGHWDSWVRRLGLGWLWGGLEATVVVMGWSCGHWDGFQVVMGTLRWLWGGLGGTVMVMGWSWAHWDGYRVVLRSLGWL